MQYLENPNNIRNICILAHVDHGKTTIADSLIASNGIISHRMAGKLRYMDSQPEEQERGITMKSSSIALKYIAQDSCERHLINLIDTPGHVDFCGEVSAAVRLCDGALIILDVVEGVSAQTIAALEQAWKEGLEPILVFNKLDRLAIEQKLDETAAYLRLEQLLEQVNAIVATLLTTEIFQSDVQNDAAKQEPSQLTKDTTDNANVYDWASTIEDVDDKFYFRPDRNNVVFASALDDWAFTIETFAQFLAKKHKINLSALRKTLWGDFYVDTKQRRIIKGAQAKAKKNLFISMILENIWKIYETVVRRDKVRIEKACQILEVKISQRDLNHSDFRHQLKVILSAWLPLAPIVLKSVCEVVPASNILREKRIDRFLCSNIRRFDQLTVQTQELKKSFLDCSANEKAVKIAFVSKMLPFERKNLPRFKKKPTFQVPSKEQMLEQANRMNRSEPTTTTTLENNQLISSESTNEGDVVFIAFARVFSGKLKRGDELFVLGPKHDPCLIKVDSSNSMHHVSTVIIQDLYLLMGRDIEPIDHADAGNIVGIEGLDAQLTRTGTLSSSIYCPPFHDWFNSTIPILRVAIEPANPQEMSMLVNGLNLLNQADPCVKVKLQETGEHVIIATGQLHLQHCIRDLQEKYTNNIELNVSQPIVPFRETIVLPPKVDMVNEAIGDRNTEISINKSSTGKLPIEVSTPNKKCTLKMKASPMPPEIQKFLNAQSSLLKIISKIKAAKSTSHQLLNDSIKERIDKFKLELNHLFNETRRESNQWKNLYTENIADFIWSFGPKNCGMNLLLAHQKADINYNIWHELYSNPSKLEDSSEGSLLSVINSVINGFQLATQAGPLCEEPMHGVCFTIHDITLDSDGLYSGQIITAAKEACRKSFQDQPQRLMSPMFSCDILVTSDMLGKMYAVLGRRHGRVLHGDIIEGSQTFEIKAFIPVIESMDFVGEIRKQTSGLANPQLIFSHYEIVDVDPFWTPKTEEEYALYGEKADTENQAKKYMNLVRRRKGLHVQEKIVEHGEKQRTNKRNK